MSQFSRMMAEGFPAVEESAGALEPAIYTPPVGEPFPWGKVITRESGVDEYRASGDLVKVLRRKVVGLTAVLLANGVVELERRATVKIGDVTYSIELSESQWSESTVTLGLKREPIVEHQRLEGNATLR